MLTWKFRSVYLKKFEIYYSFVLDMHDGFLAVLVMMAVVPHNTKMKILAPSKHLQHLFFLSVMLYHKKKQTYYNLLKRIKKKKYTYVANFSCISECYVVFTQNLPYRSAKKDVLCGRQFTPCVTTFTQCLLKFTRRSNFKKTYYTMKVYYHN